MSRDGARRATKAASCGGGAPLAAVAAAAAPQLRIGAVEGLIPVRTPCDQVRRGARHANRTFFARRKWRLSAPLSGVQAASSEKANQFERAPQVDNEVSLRAKEASLNSLLRRRRRSRRRRFQQRGAVSLLPRIRVEQSSRRLLSSSGDDDDDGDATADAGAANKLHWRHNRSCNREEEQEARGGKTAAADKKRSAAPPPPPAERANGKRIRVGAAVASVRLVFHLSLLALASCLALEPKALEQHQLVAVVGSGQNVKQQPEGSSSGAPVLLVGQLRQRIADARSEHSCCSLVNSSQAKLSRKDAATNTQAAISRPHAPPATARAWRGKRKTNVLKEPRGYLKTANTRLQQASKGRSKAQDATNRPQQQSTNNRYKHDKQHEAEARDRYKAFQAVEGSEEVASLAWSLSIYNNFTEEVVKNQVAVELERRRKERKFSNQSSEQAELSSREEEELLLRETKLKMGIDDENLMRWLRQQQERSNGSLKNATFELISEPPLNTINVCSDGPKIRVLPRTGEVFYCYTKEQWSEKLWHDLRLSAFHYPIIVLNILIFLFGTTGNIFVCLSVYRNHQLRNVTNYFIVNLAFADFLVILICLPATVVWDLSLTWFFGTVPCKLIMFLQDVSISVSVLTLAAISVDRYYAICYPLRFKSSLSQAKRVIALIWIASLITMTPDLIYLSAHESEELSEAGVDTVLYSDCDYDWPERSSKIFQFVKTILLYLLPLILMLCAHYKIMLTLRAASTTASEKLQSMSEPENAAAQVCSPQAASNQQQQQQPPPPPPQPGPHRFFVNKFYSRIVDSAARDTQLSRASPASHKLERQPFSMVGFSPEPTVVALCEPQPELSADRDYELVLADASRQLELNDEGLRKPARGVLWSGAEAGQQVALSGGINECQLEVSSCSMNNGVAEEKLARPASCERQLRFTPQSPDEPEQHCDFDFSPPQLNRTSIGPPKSDSTPVGVALVAVGSPLTAAAIVTSAAAGAKLRTPSFRQRFASKLSFRSFCSNDSSASSTQTAAAVSLKRASIVSYQMVELPTERTRGSAATKPNVATSQLLVTMHNRQKLESRRAAAKMLMTIVVLFGICYLPVHLINFLRQFIEDIPQNDATSTISMLSHCFCYLNSAINPIIYNHMNSIFRAEFRKFLSCVSWRRNKESEPEPVSIANNNSTYKPASTNSNSLTNSKFSTLSQRTNLSMQVA